MSKHTPGPWRPGCLDTWDGMTGEPLAFVYRLPPNDDRETAKNRICLRSADGETDPWFDAYLIAAAPDLLETLKTALRVIEEAAPGAFKNGNTSDSGAIDEGEVLTFDFVKRSYALVAKAEGK